MKDLSVVIPCYNEESVFKDSMRRITGHLDSSGLDYEIILIDDCSSDMTPELMRKISAGSDRISCHFHRINRGRGRTVSDGISLSHGKVVGYIDMDLEIPETSITSHYREVINGCDLTYAERSTPGFSTRTLLHHLYILLSRFALGSPFNDTNAGCKFFRKDKVMEILPEVRDSHWFWDTEILMRAHRMGLKSKGIPVTYTRNRNKKSTVKVFSDSVYFLRSLLKFRKESA